MKKTCFFITPIGVETSETRKQADKVLQYILKPVLDKSNYKIIRVDLINDNDNINETIITHLKNCDLVIADLSTHNPNVFFELGYRHALGKPCIQIKHESSNEKIPFDVSPIRTIKYDFPIDVVEEAQNKIHDTIKTIETKTKQEKTDHFNEEPYNFNEQNYENIIQKLISIENILKNDIPTKITKRDILLLKSIINQSNDDIPSDILTDILTNIIKNPNELLNTIKIAKDMNLL